MSRVRPLIVARKLSGYVVPNADVYIYERDDTEVVADHAKVELDLYTTEAGGTTIAQPLHTDSRGIAEEFWMAPESYDRRIVSAFDDFIVHDEALSAKELGGRMIDSASITAPATITSPGSTQTDVSGLVVDVPIGPRPVELVFSSYYVGCSVAARLVAIWLYDGTIHKRIAWVNVPAANNGAAVNVGWLLPVPASAKSYQLQVSVFGGLSGNVLVNAEDDTTDNVGVPAVLRAIER